MRFPPFTQADTAVMSCMGVILKVCPKDAAASCERFSGLQNTSSLHQMLPLSPPRSMPVRAVSCFEVSCVLSINPKASAYS